MPNLLLSGSTTVEPSVIQPIIDAFTSQLSPAQVVGMLALVVASGVGLVFVWWGIRKGASVIMNAFQKGKLKI